MKSGENLPCSFFEILKSSSFQSGDLFEKNDLGKFIPNFPLKHVITSTDKYGNNSRLLFTDTDSLMYEIKIEDVYKGFRNDKEMFDFSNN